MTLSINPGTEPLPETGVDEASKAMEVFAADLEAAGLGRPAITRLDSSLDYETLYPGDGRYAFQLTWEGYTREIQMPGVPVEEIRFLGTDDQNIWDYPRLYVDGSSWVWLYALKSCEPTEVI